LEKVNKETDCKCQVESVQILSCSKWDETQPRAQTAALFIGATCLEFAARVRPFSVQYDGF